MRLQLELLAEQLVCGLGDLDLARRALDSTRPAMFTASPQRSYRKPLPSDDAGHDRA